MILMTQGGVQNVGKPDDLILERSLIDPHAHLQKKSAIEAVASLNDKFITFCKLNFCQAQSKLKL